MVTFTEKSIGTNNLGILRHGSSIDGELSALDNGMLFDNNLINLQVHDQGSVSNTDITSTCLNIQMSSMLNQNLHGFFCI